MPPHPFTQESEKVLDSTAKSRERRFFLEQRYNGGVQKCRHQHFAKNATRSTEHTTKHAPLRKGEKAEDADWE
jgi:hypothetical protein